jgi:hypothetical protein
MSSSIGQNLTFSCQQLILKIIYMDDWKLDGKITWLVIIIATL